jgi:methylated-DNA-[protein]-cysteine S-methyltransferase
VTVESRPLRPGKASDPRARVEAASAIPERSRAAPDRSWGVAVLDTPVGPLRIVISDHGLSEIRFGADSRHQAAPGHPVLRSAVAQLDEYFAGRRTTFDLPLAPAGSPFQRRVWEALREIPYGRTESYGALAARLGLVNGARAVGAANGQNPLPIVVPCHRVVGANGRLVGYGGGLERKRTLLEIEARAVVRRNFGG